MTSTGTTTLYRRSDGRSLSIRDDNEIGSGGEGSIFTLDEFPDLVAKVYHNPSQSIGAKLTLMVDNPPTMPEGGGHISIAWPVDTLHGTLPATSSNVAGFLMHRIRSMQPVSQCYNPAARKRNFPHYTYRHLCAVAINIAIAVSAVHGRNYVIGDINESNILIDGQGLVTLIDTDSFQVIDQSDGTIYRSPVGKPEYTPHELQGRSFDSIDRDQYHDRFGLGVIIFQLLMEGRHPYSGRFTGAGEPPAVEENIASGHFLHCESRAVPLMEGPGYLPWGTLDGSLADLFRLCFERGHDNQIVRPTAFQWEEAITQAVGSLVICSRNPNHLYFPHNRSCPWCERRDMLRGRDPFPALPGPDPLLMRTAAPGGRAQQRGPAPRQQTPQQAPRSPPPLPQPRPLRRQMGRATLRGIPLPSDSKSAWAVLLLIVGGVSLISWGMSVLYNFIDSTLFQPSPPISSPPREATPRMPPRSPVATPAPVIAAPAFTMTATPSPTVTALPTAVTLLVVPTSTPTVEVLPTPVSSPPGPSPTATVRPTATTNPTPTIEPTPPTPQPTQTPVVVVVQVSTATPAPTHGSILIEPDLALDAQSFDWEPRYHSMGDTITFTITVVNKGGSAGLSSLRYSVFSVGLDNRLVSSGVVEVPPIHAQESADVSFELSPEAGLHVFEFEVDPEDQIVESNESDNLVAVDRALLYPGPSLADLVVESIEWSPETPAMGEMITFPVTIHNQGGGRSYPSTVRLYIDDELLGEAGLPPIPPGDSGTVSFQWLAEVGGLTLRAVADSGEDVIEIEEDNNELTVEYQATTYVDLVVEKVSWEPPNPSVGDEVTLTVTVTNQGSLDAGESAVELSIVPTNGTASSSRVLMMGIAAGETAAATFNWQAQPGGFTLRVYADIDSLIVESDEDNNVVEESYGATQLADLVVTDISWEPERPAFGEEATITVQLENRGEGSSIPSDVILYVNDSEHGEPVSIPRLSSMDSHTVTFAWLVELGEHTFSALADYGERVVESDETNNQSDTFRYDNTRVADLKVRAIDWSPERPSVGDTVSFEVTIDNQGDAPAGDFHVSFWDTSSVWPAMEKVLSGELGAGRTATVGFEWPADADQHQFVVVVDSREQITESDEGNNEYTIDYAATVIADLTVSRIVSSPRSPSVDEDSTIKVTIKNEGPGGSGPFIVTLRITGQAGLLDESNRRVDSLDAGASRTLEFAWTARAGTHTVTAKVDSREVIAETDESNNELEDTVITALADLVVTEVHFDASNLSEGDVVEIGIRIANKGGGDSRRSVAELRVIGEDEPYDSVVVGSLESGTSVYIEFSWQASEGCHNIGAIADAADDVPEEDEGNNRSQQYEICVGESQ